MPRAAIAAVADDRDPVREAVGLLEVLGGEEDRRAVVRERLDGLPDREPAARVQARARLVEEDHLGRLTRLIARSSRRRMPPL